MRAVRSPRAPPSYDKIYTPTDVARRRLERSPSPPRATPMTPEQRKAMVQQQHAEFEKRAKLARESEARLRIARERWYQGGMRTGGRGATSEGGKSEEEEEEEEAVAKPELVGFAGMVLALDDPAMVEPSIAVIVGLPRYKRVELLPPEGCTRAISLSARLRPFRLFGLAEEEGGRWVLCYWTPGGLGSVVGSIPRSAWRPISLGPAGPRLHVDTQCDGNWLVSASIPEAGTSIIFSAAQIGAGGAGSTVYGDYAISAPAGHTMKPLQILALTIIGDDFYLTTAVRIADAKSSFTGVYVYRMNALRPDDALEFVWLQNSHKLKGIGSAPWQVCGNKVSTVIGDTVTRWDLLSGGIETIRGEGPIAYIDDDGFPAYGAVGSVSSAERVGPIIPICQSRSVMPMKFSEQGYAAMLRIPDLRRGNSVLGAVVIAWKGVSAADVAAVDITNTTKPYGDRVRACAVALQDDGRVEVRIFNTADETTTAHTYDVAAGRVAGTLPLLAGNARGLTRMRGLPAFEESGESGSVEEIATLMRTTIPRLGESSPASLLASDPTLALYFAREFVVPPPIFVCFAGENSVSYLTELRASANRGRGLRCVRLNPPKMVPPPPRRGSGAPWQGATALYATDSGRVIGMVRVPNTDIWYLCKWNKQGDAGIVWDQVGFHMGFAWIDPGINVAWSAGRVVAVERDLDGGSTLCMVDAPPSTEAPVRVHLGRCEVRYLKLTGNSVYCAIRTGPELRREKGKEKEEEEEEEEEDEDEEEEGKEGIREDTRSRAVTHLITIDISNFKSGPKVSPMPLRLSDGTPVRGCPCIGVSEGCSMAFLESSEEMEGEALGPMYRVALNGICTPIPHLYPPLHPGGEGEEIIYEMVGDSDISVTVDDAESRRLQGLIPCRIIASYDARQLNPSHRFEITPIRSLLGELHRALLTNVSWASFSPDGTVLVAIVRIEYEDIDTEAFMVCLNRHTGETIFSRRVAPVEADRIWVVDQTSTRRSVSRFNVVCNWSI